MLRVFSVSLCVLALGALASPAMADVTYYVSPKGSDQATGSKSAPFKTLTRAQVAVRASNGTQNVSVVIADGVYDLAAPLRFGAEDGGQGRYKVVWTAEKGTRPLLSGGMNVAGFTLFDKAKNVYVADVPKGFDSRNLWIDDVAAERPRVAVDRRDVSFTAAGIVVSNPSLAFLYNVKDPSRMELEATGFFTDRFAPVKAIEGRTIVMQQPSWDNNTWGYDTISQPIFPEDSRLFMVNAPELFGVTNQWHSNPYQWYIDPAAGKLYVRIPEDANIKALTVTLPRLQALIGISGALDKPVKNLTLSGLRFSYTTWLAPSQPTGYASQQSGAYLNDASPVRPAEAYRTCGWGCPEFETMRQKWHQMPAAVQVSAATNVVLDDNLYSQLGQIAVGIGNDFTAHLSGTGLAAQDIYVTNSRFTGLGGGAIMAGGVREDAHHPSDPRMTNRNIVIENNTISTVSQDYKENAAVLTTYIDGAKIRRNDISDAPYDAIDIGWGWGYNDAGGNPNYRDNQKGYLSNKVYETPTTLRNTEVIGNRVHGVKSLYVDGGALYNLSANPGTVIRDNHIFSIGSAIGIYLDEGSKDIDVTRNVIETRGRWLNVNTVGKQFARGITTRNRAFGNWHNSNQIGGRWIAESGNLITDDRLTPDKAWPAEAQAVINKAGSVLKAVPAQETKVAKQREGVCLFNATVGKDCPTPDAGSK